MKKTFFFLLFVFYNFSVDAQINLALQNELSKKDISSKEYDILIKGEKNAILRLIESHNIKLKYKDDTYFAIHLNGEQLSDIVNKKFISEIYYDNSKGFLLNDRMIVNANVASLQDVGVYDQVLNGEDVIIGFIDSGVDYSHPDLINEDGSSRIKYFWDQKNPSDSTEIYDEYGYGKLITNDTINQWLESGYQTILDPNNWYGHGTTVVGTACSNGRALSDLVETGAMDYDYHGVAPKSTIIMVASDFNRTNWLASVADGVHFMLAKAEELEMPIVINLSVGSYSGSHDALDPVGTMINDWLSDNYSGRMVVCAGGNSRTLRYHLGYTSNQDSNYSIYSSFNGPIELGRVSYAELWLDSIDFASFRNNVSIYNSSTNEILSLEDGYTSIEDNLDSTFIDTLFASDSSVIGIIRKYMQSRGEQIQFQIQIDHLANANYKMLLHTTGSARVDSWSAEWFGASNIIGPEALANSIVSDTNYIAPDSLMQVVSSFSCAENVLTVANYKNRVEYTDVNGITQSFGGLIGELALHSSRGPTRDGRIKPDVSASGELILSTGPYNYMNILLSAAPHKVAAGGWHMRNGGTSMASPIVAGIAALYLQRCPYAKPSDLRQAIINTSYQDIFTGQLPNISWGNGKVDGIGAVYQSIHEIEIEENTLMCTDSLINLSAIGEYASFYWNTGDTSESICVNEGNYWVYGIDSQGCLQRSNNILVVQDGIEEYKEHKWNIFPNPSTGVFNIEGMEDVSSLRLINLLGQEQVFSIVREEEKYTFEIKNVEAGIYYLVDDNNGRFSELIITK